MGIAAHNVETIPTNLKRAGEIIYQLVDHCLGFEELWILIVDIPTS